MNLRTLKRSIRRMDGTPEKNAQTPKNTRGRQKGPARVTREEYRARVLIGSRIRKFYRAMKVKRVLEEVHQ